MRTRPAICTALIASSQAFMTVSSARKTVSRPFHLLGSFGPSIHLPHNEPSLSPSRAQIDVRHAFQGLNST